MNKEKINVAVIVGAGNGTRFGRDKIFMEINDKPVWYYSALKFQTAEKVDEIVMVVRDERVNQVWQQNKIFGLDKIENVVAGGKERKDSVKKALDTLDSKRVNLVLIHDAARPLISENLITRCIDEAETYKAVVPGVLIRDTVKKGSDFVEETLNRNELRLIQTPQVFDCDLLKKAYENNSFNGTDDCSFVERLGYPVKIIPGEETNLKITYPIDLDLVSFVMSRH